MATTKKFFVFATFWLACGAVALLVTSYSTNEWVIADLAPPNNTGLTGRLNYGLFTGSFGKSYSSSNPKLYNIYMTCVADKNKCAWSCHNKTDTRLEEVNKLIEIQENIPGCPAIEESSSKYITRSVKLTPNPINYGEYKDPKFVNMGLWLCTLISLSIALLDTLMCALLGLLNTASNPISTVFAVKGLFYWNGLAAALDLLTLILWGSQFAITLKDNVALAEVINGDFQSKDKASLGYSYWLILVAMLISIGNVALLGIRHYLLSNEPPPPAPQFDEMKTDGVIFLY